MSNLINRILGGEVLRCQATWEAGISLVGMEAKVLTQIPVVDLMALKDVINRALELLVSKTRLEINADDLGINCEENGFWLEMNDAITDMHAYIVALCDRLPEIDFDVQLQRRLIESDLLSASEELLEE